MRQDSVVQWEGGKEGCIGRSRESKRRREKKKKYIFDFNAVNRSCMACPDCLQIRFFCINLFFINLFFIDLFCININLHIFVLSQLTCDAMMDESIDVAVSIV
jgi:hypothetical protein